MSNTDKPLVLGFIPVRAALTIVYAIGGLWFVTAILDAAGVWPDPPETISVAFMGVLSPLVGGLMQARKDKGPPAEVVERDRLEREQRGERND